MILENYNETLQIGKPWMIGRNMFLGKQYWDLECQFSSTNLSNGMKIDVQIAPESKSRTHSVTGKFFD